MRELELLGGREEIELELTDLDNPDADQWLKREQSKSNEVENLQVQENESNQHQKHVKSKRSFPSR